MSAGDEQGIPGPDRVQRDGKGCSAGSGAGVSRCCGGLSSETRKNLERQISHRSHALFLQNVIIYRPNVSGSKSIERKNWLCLRLFQMRLEEQVMRKQRSSFGRALPFNPEPVHRSAQTQPDAEAMNRHPTRTPFGRGFCCSHLSPDCWVSVGKRTVALLPMTCPVRSESGLILHIGSAFFLSLFVLMF